tara:strand:- start:171 stop:416 length:246 start_codon:yes stop_codon:yes gene_type:complete
MSAMHKFTPSPESLTPKKQALKSLAYAKKAIGKLEAYLKTADDDDVPSWVLTRINQAASCAGQAVSFVQFKTSKTSKKEET